MWLAGFEEANGSRACLGVCVCVCLCACVMCLFMCLCVCVCMFVCVCGFVSDLQRGCVVFCLFAVLLWMVAMFRFVIRALLWSCCLVCFVRFASVICSVVVLGCDVHRYVW